MTSNAQAMSIPDWYLLYDGTSADGMGPGNYAGRTTSKDEALSHFRSVSASPYSVGYVVKITDSTFKRIFRIEEL